MKINYYVCTVLLIKRPSNFDYITLQTLKLLKFIQFNELFCLYPITTLSNFILYAYNILGMKVLIKITVSIEMLDSCFRLVYYLYGTITIITYKISF